MKERDIYFNYLRKIHAISHLEMEVFKTNGTQLLQLSTQLEDKRAKNQRKNAAAYFREYIFSILQEREYQLREQGILKEGEPYSFFAVLYSHNNSDYLLFLGPFTLLPANTLLEECDLPAYTYDEIIEFAPLFSENIVLPAMLEYRKEVPLVKEQSDFAYNNAVSILKNRAFEVSFLRAIQTGDETGLAKLLEIMDYQDAGHYSPAEDLRNYKNLALAMNTLSCRAAEDSKAPIDIFVRSMCASYATRIEAAKTKNELNRLRKELAVAYCHKVSQTMVSGYSKMVRSAISYLDVRLSEEITLSDVADFCGVSGPHLSRSIKKECQIGFQELLIRQRIQRAQLFLLSGMSPSEAAEQSGFKTLSHFCRVFKKNTGMTTTQWLQSR